MCMCVCFRVAACSAQNKELQRTVTQLEKHNMCVSWTLVNTQWLFPSNVPESSHLHDVCLFVCFRSLMAQLHKLQALIKQTATKAAQTSTCIMVRVRLSLFNTSISLSSDQCVLPPHRFSSSLWLYSSSRVTVRSAGVPSHWRTVTLRPEVRISHWNTIHNRLATVCADTHGEGPKIMNETSCIDIQRIDQPK